MRLRITQEEIARLAEVSQSTVSRVVANDPKVEEALRDRVLAVMSEHNYRPDVRARSLRQKHTGLIGLVVKRPAGGLTDDPFFANLVSNITDFLGPQPYHLCLDVASDSGQQADVYDEMLRTRRVDGVLIIESEARDERIHILQKDRFPFVLIGNPMDESTGIYSVDNDNVLAGQIATEHLIQSGYRRIGMIAGLPGITVSDDRIRGYRESLESSRLPCQVWHSEFGFEAAKKTAERALADKERPDALVVLDDFMAMGAIMAAQNMGLDVPNELGVVGFNDSSLCNMVAGGISSVSLNMPLLVRSACQILIRVVEGKYAGANTRTIVPCELKVRGSSQRRRG